MKKIVLISKSGPDFKPELTYDGDYSWQSHYEEPTWERTVGKVLLGVAAGLMFCVAFAQVIHFCGVR